MTKNIALLGSTGSIGVQTLEVARGLGIKISAITGNTNIELLEKQCREFKPRIAVTGTKELACQLRNRIADIGIEVVYGQEGLLRAASVDEADTVLSAIVGIAGLLPTMAAVEAGKNIALANKETLVTAGSLFTNLVNKKNIKVLPVDSEHAAIFQCLAGNRHQDVEKLILTASGGPFRGKKTEELESMKVEEALNHPNWKMGRKITIDSATLMNKGLEVIEARWLFDIEPGRISVAVHPQSIIHSMVEFRDGSIIAQLGSPDMRIPIQLALTWPERHSNNFNKTDIFKCGDLTFEKPDTKTFPCLRLAYDAIAAGGTMPAVLNGANEAAVELFLNGAIKFTQIPEIIDRAMSKHSVISNPKLEDIIVADREARMAAGGVT